MERLSDIVPQEEYTRYIRLGAGRTIMVMPELQKSSENSLQDILVVRLLM
nr:MAG TPA: hypothetical protein [Caudoviricetes sp.]